MDHKDHKPHHVPRVQDPKMERQKKLDMGGIASGFTKIQIGWLAIIGMVASSLGFIHYFVKGNQAVAFFYLAMAVAFLVMSATAILSEDMGKRTKRLDKHFIELKIRLDKLDEKIEKILKQRKRNWKVKK